MTEALEEWAFSCPNEDMKAASALQVTHPSSNASDVAISDAFASYWPHQAGKDIGIVGSGALVRPLLASEPLDELGLMVHPRDPGQRKCLVGDTLTEGAKSRGFEDVRHGRRLPHLPAGGRVGRRAGFSKARAGKYPRRVLNVALGRRIQHGEIWRIK